MKFDILELAYSDTLNLKKLSWLLALVKFEHVKTIAISVSSSNVSRKHSMLISGTNNEAL